MNEFENLSIFDLRKLLVDTIVKKMGRDYAFGWLHTTYVYGATDSDNDRNGVIAQIQEFRSRAI